MLVAKLHGTPTNCKTPKCALVHRVFLVHQRGAAIMSDWIINDILKRSEEAEARKPRINCPTHGNTLICASCRKCLSCIWEEGKASQLRWCLKRRHTFLNLGAPCKYCRGQGGTSAVHTTDESKCSPCWHRDYDAYQKQRAEEARRYVPKYTSLSTLDDDDYLPDYDGEDEDDGV